MSTRASSRSSDPQELREKALSLIERAEEDELSVERIKRFLDRAKKVPGFYLTGEELYRLLEASWELEDEYYGDFDIEVKPPYSEDLFDSYGDIFDEDDLGEMIREYIEMNRSTLSRGDIRKLKELAPDADALYDMDESPEPLRMRDVAAGAGLLSMIGQWLWGEKKTEEQPEAYTRYRSDYAPGDLDAAGYESEDSFEQRL